MNKAIKLACASLYHILPCLEWERAQKDHWHLEPDYFVGGAPKIWDKLFLPFGLINYNSFLCDQSD